MKGMAQTVSITTKENVAKIIVDGNEVSDVLSYRLEETENLATLTLKLAVKGKIEAQIE